MPLLIIKCICVIKNHIQLSHTNVQGTDETSNNDECKIPQLSTFEQLLTNIDDEIKMNDDDDDNNNYNNIYRNYKDLISKLNTTIEESLSTKERN